MKGCLSRIVGMKIDKINDNKLCVLSADDSLRYWNMDSTNAKFKAS